MGVQKFFGFQVVTIRKFCLKQVAPMGKLLHCLMVEIISPLNVITLPENLI